MAIQEDPILQTIGVLDEYFGSVNGAIEEFISSGDQNDPDLQILSKQYEEFTKLYIQVKETIILKSEEGLIETGQYSVPPDYINKLREPLVLYKGVAEVNKKIADKFNAIPRDIQPPQQKAYNMALKTQADSEMENNKPQLKMVKAEATKILKDLKSKRAVLLKQKADSPVETISLIDSEIAVVESQINQYNNMIEMANQYLKPPKPPPPAPPSDSAGGTGGGITLDQAQAIAEELAVRFGLDLIIDVFDLLMKLKKVYVAIKLLIDTAAELWKDMNVNVSYAIRQATHEATLERKTKIRLEEWRNRLIFPISTIFGLLMSVLASAMSAFSSLIRITGGNPAKNGVLTAMSNFMSDATSIFNNVISVFNAVEATTNFIISAPTTIANLVNDAISAVNNTINFVSNLPSNIASIASATVTNISNSINSFINNTSTQVPSTPTSQFSQAMSDAFNAFSSEITGFMGDFQSDMANSINQASQILAPNFQTSETSAEINARIQSEYLNSPEF